MWARVNVADVRFDYDYKANAAITVRQTFYFVCDYCNFIVCDVMQLFKPLLKYSSGPFILLRIIDWISRFK